MKRPFHASLLPLQPASAAAIEICFAAFGNSKSTHSKSTHSGLRGEQRAEGGALALRQPRRPHIQQQHHPLPFIIVLVALAVAVTVLFPAIA